MENANSFSRLTLEGWRQFGEIDIDLHPSLTILTGGNGAGKSTLLNLFSQHFGYQRPYLATPQRDEKSGGYQYMSGIFAWLKARGKTKPNVSTQSTKVGELFYSNGSKAIAEVPNQGGVQYNLSLQGQAPVEGFHIPSHRQMPIYRQVATIPTQPMLPQQAYDIFNGEMSALFSGGHTGLSPTYRIKEALLSMAVFGPGSIYVQRNDVVLKAFQGYIDVLKMMLPEELGFLDISIRTPDVVLVTKSGEFLLDAASGGVTALIDLAWQIHMFSLRSGGRGFVVTIDEPENHLHPAMQRTLMTNLVKAFPKAQFIVATHSPFIVGSLKAASVYALRYSEESDGSARASMAGGDRQTRYVSSVRLRSSDRSGSAGQILRDVLGLPTTYPEWVEDDVDRVLEKYKGRPFNSELLGAVRADLEVDGLSEFYPDALAKLAKK